MQLTIELIKSFAKAQLENYDLEFLALDQIRVLKALEKEIRSDYEELNNDKVKISRWKHFDIPNTLPESYSERVKALDEHKKIIYGIRHYSGDKTKPFVHLVSNFSINDKKQIIEIYKEIEDELKFFGPKWICIKTKAFKDSDFTENKTMVANTNVVDLLTKASKEEGLSLKQVKDDSYYQWYKEGYTKFLKERADLKTDVDVNTYDIMEDSRKEGLLYSIHLNSERIGLIAAEYSELLGYEGVYFNEIFIDQKWKGKKLAKAAQRIFMRDFCKDKLVWGTIFSKNLPSLKTAMSNHRKAIIEEHFIKLE